MHTTWKGASSQYGSFRPYLQLLSICTNSKCEGEVKIGNPSELWKCSACLANVCIRETTSAPARLWHFMAGRRTDLSPVLCLTFQLYKFNKSLPSRAIPSHHHWSSLSVTLVQRTSDRENKSNTCLVHSATLIIKWPHFYISIKVIWPHFITKKSDLHNHTKQPDLTTRSMDQIMLLEKQFKQKRILSIYVTLTLKWCQFLMFQGLVI